MINNDSLKFEAELYNMGNSITQVSEITGTPISTLRFRFKKLGILRTVSEALKIRLNNPDYNHPRKGVRFNMPKEWRENIGKSLKGKGKGFKISSAGYMEYTMGENKGRGFHVVAIENKIGRRIKSDECVHHIDENKLNNSLDNLVLMTRSEHAKLHATQNYKNRKINKKGQFV